MTPIIMFVFTRIYSTVKTFQYIIILLHLIPKPFITLLISTQITKPFIILRNSTLFTKLFITLL